METEARLEPRTVVMAGGRGADTVVRVSDVFCRYGDFTAVTGASLEVRRGEIHALLGTNGAGKTTLLETIQGLREPASGTIEVFGHDPARRRTEVAERSGTMLQESGLVDEMTVTDQLRLWRGLNLRSDSIDRVLGQVGLGHRRKVPVAVLSGGERRRLDFAMAMWGGPELLVLDEPTTGLDPQSRRAMWAIIRELKDGGTTVLLTTHYLEEAQELAESVTILDRGRVAVEGPMTEVLSTIAARITFTAGPEAPWSLLGQRLSGELTADTEFCDDGRQVLLSIHTSDLQSDVGVVVDWSREHGMRLDQLRCAPASLEEVFFELRSINGREAQA